MPKPTYLLDGHLVARIKQIVRADKGRVTVTYLTEELQSKYGVYARKKKNVLMRSVEKGFATAMKELQKEGIQISTNSSSSSASGPDYKNNQGKDKDIMNSMINSMYKQGQTATPTSVNKGVSTVQITSVFSPVDSQKRSPKVLGAHAEADGLQYTDSLSVCTDRSTTPAGQVELEVSQNGHKHFTGNNDRDLANGDDSSDKKVVNFIKSQQPKKRKRSEKEETDQTEKRQRQAIYPKVNFSDFGGNDQILKKLENRCFFLGCPKILHKMGNNLMKSFLFHGPPGCGKTMLAHALAGEYEVPLLDTLSSDLMGADFKKKMEDLFNQAVELAPCIVLLRNVETIASKRETDGKNIDSSILNQLCKSMDDLMSSLAPVLIICTTSKPNSLDTTFRRCGRIHFEFALKYPDKDARESILEVLCENIQMAGDISVPDIALLTHSYTGSDLKALITGAVTAASCRVLFEQVQGTKQVMDCGKSRKDRRRQKVVLSVEEVDSLHITLSKSDIEEAFREMKPTAKQHDINNASKITWSDLGGLDEIKNILNVLILGRIRNPELYDSLHMSSSAGILLVGPPGCGKTSIAKAVANEGGFHFIYVSGAELLNKYVGQSEQNVIELFQNARGLAPCIIFFDEIDSICSKRGSEAHEGSSDRFTNQILLEMDGFSPREHVYLIAATNRPDRLDPALVRPGRLQKKCFIGLPTPEERVVILQTRVKNENLQLADDVDLDAIGKDSRCDGCSGADMYGLLEAAKHVFLGEALKKEVSQQPKTATLNKSHFEIAMKNVHPSTNKEDRVHYGFMEQQLLIE